MNRAASLDELALLLVDGDNLLHDVRGGRDAGGVAWLLPRLSRWRPDHLRIVVALDGHPAPGEASRRRAARGIDFQHAGSRSADDLIIELLSTAPFSARAHCAVVTRDSDLADRARRAGGMTRSVDWLMRQLDGPAGAARQGAAGTPTASIGQGKPPRPRLSDGARAYETERDPWQPGRGATRKRGNPRRDTKATRQR